jgi:hypothetical protein
MQERSLIAPRPILRLLGAGFHQLRLSTTLAGRILFLFDALGYLVVYVESIQRLLWSVKCFGLDT